MEATMNTERQLANGASDLASLGYQPEPQLLLGELGGFSRYTKEGTLISKVLFKDEISKAWDKLLAEMTARNIPIPDILQTPHFFSVDDENSVGIHLTPNGIEVSAWGEDMSNKSWTATTYNRFRVNSYTKGVKRVDADTKAKMIILGYRASRKGYVESSDMQCSLDEIYVMICNRTLTTGEEIKQSMNGKYHLYELANPFSIPFEQPLTTRLSLLNAEAYDILLPLGNDGEEMWQCDTEIEETAEGKHILHQDYHFNREWVAEMGHQPLPLTTFMHGWGELMNYAWFKKLREDVDSLMGARNLL